jgi:serine/threonine protein phosphatase PrpC
MPLRIEIAAGTDPGRKRKENEDSYALLDERRLYMVADGMGGHSSGEVASKMAIDVVREVYAETARVPPESWAFKWDATKQHEENRLTFAVQRANERIYAAAAADLQRRGMGTTVVAAALRANGVTLAHVGDSRAYLVRDRRIHRLTEDHTLANDLLRSGAVAPEDVAALASKNVLTRALGLKATVVVDTRLLQPMGGDILILCSDGLSSVVDEEDISDIAWTAKTSRDAAIALIGEANASGGPDNVTVILMRWTEDGA